METKYSDNGWTDRNEQLIKTIANKHGSLAWMYKKSAEWYEKLHTVFGIVVVAGLYVIETAGLFSFLSDPEGLRILIVTTNVIGIIIGMAKTVSLFYKELRRAGEHRWSSGQHYRILKDIEYELVKPVIKREKWNRFYKKICNVELELQSNTPQIPKRIIKRYYEEWGNQALGLKVLFRSQYILARKFSIISAESKQGDIEKSASIQKKGRDMAKRKITIKGQIQYWID